MFKIEHNDIFESKASAWVNPVNTQGVMGAGLALAFKRKFPDMYLDYREVCRAGDLKMGQVWVWATLFGNPPDFIICFPTKDHWKDASRMEDISSGLLALKSAIREWQISSIAIPALGCGLGGLKWPEVEAEIKAQLKEEVEQMEIFLYPPQEKIRNQKHYDAKQ